MKSFGSTQPIGSACNDENVTTDNDTCQAGAICLGKCQSIVTFAHTWIMDSPLILFASSNSQEWTSVSVRSWCMCSSCARDKLSFASTWSTLGVNCSYLVSQCTRSPKCSRGTCFVGEPVLNGTSCNDGDPASDFDQCLSGSSEGFSRANFESDCVALRGLQRNESLSERMKSILHLKSSTSSSCFSR